MAWGSSPRLSTMEFDCPRCKSRTEQEYYAPCEEVCIPELRAQQHWPKPDDWKPKADWVKPGEHVPYEPKMNVTPNSVATKDD